MKKKFNVTGLCLPKKHYMVKLDDRLAQIKELVDDGNYFTINRARQYGKTTTLKALKEYLQNEYIVVGLDFQRLGNASFENENIFALTFASYFLDVIKRMEGAFKEAMKATLDELQAYAQEKDKSFSLYKLFVHMNEICSVSDKPIVLMIDEVDSATNNQVFLDFLAQLRGFYLDRTEVSTFQSVILAGVYDVKNLKRKIQSEDDHKMNSPWNIATDFEVDMSFSQSDIARMLEEYEHDYHTGMDINQMSSLIYEDTSGYPFLVSWFCKLIDEKVLKNKSAAWTREGFLEAERMILSDKNTLFDSLINKIMDYPELNSMIHSMLFTGKSIVYNPDNAAIDIAIMFGFVKKEGGIVVLANRIFETRLYNWYLSTSDVQSMEIYKASLKDKNQFIIGGHLDMRLILEKFAVHFNDLYSDSNATFLEDDGRKYFLLYLRPIINGIGNYYVESRTRDLRRTDVIVDYKGEQFIIEMKIWHGEEYKRRGEEQLIGYLDDYHKKTGYLISFNFNKNKQIGVQDIVVGDKKIIEVVV